MINQDKLNEIKGLIKDENDEKALELYLSNFKKKKFWNSPLAPILLSAVFAILGTGVGAWLQGRANLELEQKKFESELILNTLGKVENQTSAVKNLNFLVKAGLISDEDGAISDLINHPEEIPRYGLVGYEMREQAGQNNIIENAQIKLKDLGFYAGEIDGEESETLAEAVKQFQASRDKPADGIISVATYRWINRAHEQWRSNKEN